MRQNAHDEPSFRVGLATHDTPSCVTDFQLGADFDEDGDDLARWRSGFGTSGTAIHTQGDADGDHAAADVDFLAWQRQLGSPALAASANVPIPESAISMLVIVAAVRIRRLGVRMRQEHASAWARSTTNPIDDTV